MTVEWNFEKLPKSEHNKAIEAFENKNISVLLQLHNQYKLSNNIYCCSDVDESMLNWFKFGINNKKIQR